MKSHHDLKVWHASIQLAISVYGLTRKFPDEERYGLTSQMRRAAISIASNIAEGFARQGTKEFIHFLYIAVGSANELDTHAEIGKGVGIITSAEADLVRQDMEEVLKMLHGLIRSLKSKTARR